MIRNEIIRVVNKKLEKFMRDVEEPKVVFHSLMLEESRGSSRRNER